MKDFFKEFWLWILVPFALVLGGLAVLVLLVGDNSVDGFIYGLF